VNRQPAPVLRLDEDPAFASREAAEAEGRRLVAAGKVGVFLVAGGQGSRLGYDGPKGCLPVGPLTEKTLFQLHAEKIAFLIERGGRLPWYIMTSPSNDAATREFFAAHSFFGLRKEDIFFLPQRMLPALDAAGKLILESKGSLFQSPNGHGGAYAAFRDGGSIEMRSGAHRAPVLLQVDNPLVRSADPFMGLHALAGSEMSLQILRKTGPEENEGSRSGTAGGWSSATSLEARPRRRARGESLLAAGSIAIPRSIRVLPQGVRGTRRPLRREEEVALAGSRRRSRRRLETFRARRAPRGEEPSVEVRREFAHRAQNGRRLAESARAMLSRSTADGSKGRRRSRQGQGPRRLQRGTGGAWPGREVAGSRRGRCASSWIATAPAHPPGRSWPDPHCSC
jgi:hypothetical protein